MVGWRNEELEGEMERRESDKLVWELWKPVAAFSLCFQIQSCLNQFLQTEGSDLESCWEFTMYHLYNCLLTSVVDNYLTNLL